MELPQLEQALLLAEMARERSELSVTNPTGGGLEGGAQTGPNGVLAGAGATGLLPLALAWEGSALALLAARGKQTLRATVALPPADLRLPPGRIVVLSPKQYICESFYPSADERARALVGRLRLCSQGGEGGGVLDGRDVLDLMHSRSRMTIDFARGGWGIVP